MKKPSNHFRIKKGYDRLSFVYDWLIFFSGNWVKKSQLSLLDQINSIENALLIGDGTGYFMTELAKRFPSAKISYVDISSKMTVKAARRWKRLSRKSNLDFCNPLMKTISIEEFISQNSDSPGYDFISTNFFLDQYDSVHVEKLLLSLQKLLNDKGLWYFTDFTPSNRIWNHWLILVLYYFFQKFTSIQAKKLLDYQNLFLNIGLEPLFESNGPWGVKTIIWKKKSP